jgi:hypothetical protein
MVDRHAASSVARRHSLLRASSWLAAALSVVGCVLCGCGEASTDPAAGILRWAPPTLSHPSTITLGNGYTETHLETNRDYVVKLPATDKLGGVTLEGGHNIVVIGGHITVPANSPPGHVDDRFRTGLYIKGATGTVHVEGVLFDGAPGAVFDAIDIDAPKATVQLEDIRAEGIKGRFNGFHADAVQPWGGVKDLRIDYFSATSNYQGITIPIDKGPIGSAQVSHVDMHGLLAEHEKGGHLLWLTTGSRTCHSYPVQLSDVYVQPRRDLTFGESVWPQVGRPRSCGAKTRNGFASWPRLPNIQGRVRAGSPPGGPYVPPGVAGTGYVTRGYLN